VKKLWLGMLLGLVFVAIGAFVFISAGAFPLAADSPPDLLDDLAPQVRNGTIKKKAAAISRFPATPAPSRSSAGSSTIARTACRATAPPRARPPSSPRG
jgi:hypothetical protein